MPQRRSFIPCAFAAALAIGSLSSCEQAKTNTAPRAFCVEYLKLDEKLSNTYTKDPVERAKAQLPLFRSLKKVAPTKLVSDISLLIGGYEAVLAGTRPSAPTKKFEEAAGRLNRYGSLGCGVYDRKGVL